MDFDVGLLYNKTLFKQAGLNPDDPPTTTTQLEADAFKLTKQEKNGRLPSWASSRTTRASPMGRSARSRTWDGISGASGITPRPT